MGTVMLVLSLLIPGALVAQSQPPSPTPTESVKQPKADSNKHGDSTKNDARPATKTVTTLQPPSPSAHKPEAANQAGQGEDYASAEWGLVWVTLFLVAVTACLAIFTAKLWGSTKRLAGDAQEAGKRQAREMQQSLAIGERTVLQMKDTAERQLRAYLVARPGNLLVDKDRQPGSYWLEWHPEIINTGQTPAYDVRSIAKAGIRPDPLPPGTDLMDEFKPGGGGSRGILGREQMIWPSCDLGYYLSEALRVAPFRGPLVS